MPLITKTITSIKKVAMCDWPRCRKEAQPNRVPLTKAGASAKPYLCQPHGDRLNAIMDPLLLASSPTPTARRRTGGARATPASSNRTKPSANRTRARPTKTINLTGVPPSAEVREHQAAMREWAVANGYMKGTRGRIPLKAQRAYAAEHPAPAGVTT